MAKRTTAKAEKLLPYALFDAIADNDVARIKRIVETQPEQLSELRGGESPFTFFLKLGESNDEWPDGESYREALHFFLDKKSPVINKDGDTILHALHAHITPEDYISIQKQVGLDINVRNAHGETPLWVWMHRDGEIFQYLLKLPESDITAKDNQGNNLLHEAALYSNVEVVETLLKRGCEINALNAKGLTPLGQVIDIKSDTNDPEALERALYLIQHGGLLDPNNPDENVPLIKAISLGYDVKNSDAVRVGKLCKRMLAAEDSSALAKAVNAVPAGHLSCRIDNNHPSFDTDVILDAIVRRFSGDTDKVAAFREALKVCMGSSCQLYLPSVQTEDGVEIFNNIIWELKNLGTKISRRIPEGKNSPEFIAFAEVLGKAHAFAGALDPRHPQQVSILLADMMERTDGSWQKVRDSLQGFSKADCKDVADAMRGFTESILLPEIAQRTRSRTSLIDYKKVVDMLVPEVATVLAGDRPLSTMLKLSRAWHNRLPVLDNARTIRRSGSWEKAAPDFTASNGYVMTFLDTADKLSSEGSALHHCVGGYTEKCKHEGVHIASIRKVVSDGDDTYLAPVSTVEFKEQPNGSNPPLKIVQHRGNHDATPAANSPEAAVLKEFMTRIDKEYKGKGKITIDFKRIHARRMEIANKASAEDVKGMVGYDPFDRSAPDKQDEYFKLYLDISSQSGRTNSFIPGGGTKWSGKTAEDFLRETNLLDKAMRMAENPPLLEKRGVARP